MGRLNPLNDFAFQKLFGEEEVKDVLISFLNAVLGLEGEHRIVGIGIIEYFVVAEPLC